MPVTETEARRKSRALAARYLSAAASLSIAFVLEGQRLHGIPAGENT